MDINYSNIEYKFSSVFGMMQYNANNFRNKKYLFYYDDVYTYGDVYKKIIATANVLKASGVKKGDRVVIFMHNSPEYIFSYFAILSIGAIAIPTNYFLKESELAVNMNDCTAKFIITSEQYSDVMKGITRRVPSLERIFTFTDASFLSTNINSIEPDYTENITATGLNDTVSLIYTSGTTGIPKGVMLSNRNLLSNAHALSIVLEGKSSYRYVAILPIFHSYAFMVNITGPLYDASSIVMLESVTEMQKDSFRKMLMKLRPTVLTGVPQIYSALAKKKLSFIQRLFMPIKLYVSGGAPLPEETINAFKASYRKPIIEGYGLSEASPVVALNPIKWQKAGTVGTASPWCEAVVKDAEGKDLPINTTGELCIRGDNVMSGYWNQPEETANVLRDGWLHTGDLATVDEDGFIRIVGRLKELIISKGMNVYPREIEELLHKHEHIAVAAVVGIPESDGSEIIIAFVKAEAGSEINESELKSYIRKNLANYKVPKHFVITDNIPVNAGGKVLKLELKETAIKMFGKKS